MGSLTGAETSIALRVARVLLIAAGLAGWFWTQRILAARAFPAGGISDRIHEWTGPWNRYLREHPSAASATASAEPRRSPGDPPAGRQSSRPPIRSAQHPS